MDFETLTKAVQSIPHVGQLLSVTLTVAVAIYEELKVWLVEIHPIVYSPHISSTSQKLDSTLAAEKELAEEASYIIRDVAMYSRNFTTCDPVHLERLAKKLKDVEE